MGFLRSIVLSGFLIICQNIAFALGQEFCYTRDACNPSRWRGECQTGRRQSPIDIPLSPTDLANPAQTDLFLSSCYSDRQSFNLENSGNTVEAELQGDQTSRCTLTGDLLRNTYIFSQIHFHWGSTNLRGSEHSVNRQTYVMEGHLVHYRSDFNNVTQALASREPDALTVLGILFTTSRFDNPALEPIIRALRSVRTARTTTQGSGLVLADFLKSNGIPNVPVMQYDGSLTTPDCNEAVLWNIFSELQTISQAQLDELRRINDNQGQPLVDNDRPVQPLNGRVIRHFRTSIQAEKSPRQDIFRPASSSGPSQNIFRPASSSGSSQDIFRPASSSGSYQDIFRPASSSGFSQNIFRPASSSGSSQDIFRPASSSGFSQNIFRPASSSGSSQDIFRPASSSGPSQNIFRPASFGGPSQDIFRPASFSGPRQDTFGSVSPHRNWF